jgi:F-type H+-transporting ATPase subunit c
MADAESVKIAAYIAAGLCMGIGTLGPALGMGIIGGKSCDSIGKRPEAANAIFKTMIIALAFVEAVAVYALLIALLLLIYLGK